jgi:hypothetical protein
MRRAQKRFINYWRGSRILYIDSGNIGKGIVRKPAQRGFEDEATSAGIYLQ